MFNLLKSLKHNQGDAHFIIHDMDLIEIKTSLIEQVIEAWI
jgi:hypothetical protein